MLSHMLLLLQLIYSHMWKLRSGLPACAFSSLCALYISSFKRYFSFIFHLPHHSDSTSTSSTASPTDLSETQNTQKMKIKEGYVFQQETHLTVLKTSLFFTGDGFTVYGSNGQLVFRVDSYGPYTRDKDQVVLMDPHGRCLLTLRRKKPSLHQRWEGFRGERIDGDKPIFSVKRSSIIGRSRATVTVEVYDSPGEEYQIEGCFSQRYCKVYNATRESVAEIRRKVDPTTSVVLGKEVFALSVEAGFDGAFAMGLVLVLDQINGDGYNDNGTSEPVVHRTTED